MCLDDYGIEKHMYTCIFQFKENNIKYSEHIFDTYDIIMIDFIQHKMEHFHDGENDETSI